MSTHLRVAAAVAAAFWLLQAPSANAALLSRAGGQAYYDTDLNITWLADANLAATNPFGVSGIPTTGGFAGEMTWDKAQSWITAMNAANYLGVSNWRLPSADVNGDNAIAYCAVSSAAACRDNEMGYMYYQEGVTAYTASLAQPFTNLIDAGDYWFGTEYAPDTSQAWVFVFGYGGQNPGSKSVINDSWAVSPGDTVVPLPGAALLFPSALAALGWVRRKQHAA